MTHDDSLAQLQQKASRKKSLEAKLQELKDQRRKYEWNRVSLRASFHQEQEDAAKLEGRSLANYFYQVIGKLDDKLDEQRREAYAAKVKLDAAELELSGIERDIQEIQAELSEVRIAEVQYLQEFEQKKTRLKSSGTEAGENILKMESNIASLESQKKEIHEAISAGYSAKATAEQILSQLKDAEGWNTWDILGGDGIITHMAKHSHLDAAQDLVSELQSKLRRFKTELADIQITANLQVNLDGFLRFADYFFDGIFADWAVGDKISQSISSVTDTKNQIIRVLDKLGSMETDVDQRIEMARQKIENFVIHV